MLTPFVVDDFLRPDLYAGLRKASMPLSYGAKSNSETDPHGHWSWKPVHDQQKNLADLSDQLRQFPLILQAYQAVSGRLSDLDSASRCLIRCYVNAHTYGVDGYFHCDSERGDDLTAILYLCERWNKDWAGETVWRSDSTCPGGIAACLPAPNRLLVIPSIIMHAARAVSRRCNELRTTMVFKMRPRRKDQFETLSKWLVEMGALRLAHQEGSLHDHLIRVYQLLEVRGLEPAVALGGGLHSIYGTNAFPQRLLEPHAANRAMVATKFGAAAEALAYLFSVLDRPATLEKAPIILPGQRRLRLTYDQSMGASEEMLRQLQMIECANLADQGALSKWPALRELWK